MNPCLIVPVYDHGATAREVVRGLEPLGLPCYLIDDGSAAPTRDALAAIEREHAFVVRIRRERNAGKGAALREGFEAAAAAGYTHVLHLDADGQHETADVPKFLERMKAHPEAMVLGAPQFDASAPRLRIAARQLSRGLVWLATLSFAIHDPLCGFRGLPLAPVLRVIRTRATGDRMEFEPELAVRLYWAGVPVANLPTRVVYPDGGLSHFDFWSDYPRLSWLYLRLVLGMLPRAPRLLSRTREELP